MATNDPICDCTHPMSYHHAEGNCGFSPPHSSIRCACKWPTTTGVERLQVYSESDPSWKPWKGWPDPVLP